MKEEEERKKERKRERKRKREKEKEREREREDVLPMKFCQDHHNKEIIQSTSHVIIDHV